MGSSNTTRHPGRQETTTRKFDFVLLRKLANDEGLEASRLALSPDRRLSPQSPAVNADFDTNKYVVAT
jgi:hypothetical protein